MKLSNWLYPLILWSVHDVFSNCKTIVEALPQFPMGFPGMFNPIKPFIPFFNPMPFPGVIPSNPAFPNVFGNGGAKNTFPMMPNPFSFFGGFKNPFIFGQQPAAQMPASVYPQPNWNDTATPKFRSPNNPSKSNTIKVNIPSSSPSSVVVSTKVSSGGTYVDPMTELKHDDYGGTKVDLWGNFADNAVSENGQILIPNSEQNPPPLVLPNSAAPDDVTQPF